PKILNSLDALPAEHRLKGDRSAYQKIWADSTCTDFSKRMRGYVWRLRLDRTCTSTAGLCASPNAAATPSFKSVQSQYGASTELPDDHASNSKHNSFTKHRSKW